MKKRVIALVCVVLLVTAGIIFGATSSFDSPVESVYSEIDLNAGQGLKYNDLTSGIVTDDKSYEGSAVTVESLPSESYDSKTQEHKDLTCTLIVKCDTIFNNIDMLSEQKKEIIPQSGIIYSAENVTFFDEESVFNVLLREMKQNKIHFEFEMTPVYESAYIKGIANIYEFDCGDLSGWMYKVNGVSPDISCSLYKLKQGDNIEILYTCDMGKDLGDSYATE